MLIDENVRRSIGSLDLSAGANRASHGLGAGVVPGDIDLSVIHYHGRVANIYKGGRAVRVENKVPSIDVELRVAHVLQVGSRVLEKENAGVRHGPGAARDGPRPHDQIGRAEQATEAALFVKFDDDFHVAVEALVRLIRPVTPGRLIVFGGDIDVDLIGDAVVVVAVDVGHGDSGIVCSAAGVFALVGGIVGVELTGSGQSSGVSPGLALAL